MVHRLDVLVVHAHAAAAVTPADAAPVVDAVDEVGRPAEIERVGAEWIVRSRRYDLGHPGLVRDFGLCPVPGRVSGFAHDPGLTARRGGPFVADPDRKGQRFAVW